MSRHRDIRNLNIQDELDDHALSDGGDELTPDQEAQLNQGLEQVRVVIGGGDVSLLSDNTIKDVLWEYYFDVEKTIHWAVEEQQRRQIAKDRKENWDTVLVPEYDNEHHQYIPHDQVGHYNVNENSQDYVEMNTGPRLPSIFLAQQQPGFDNEAYFAVDSPRPLKKFLSTISERTERTEPSTPFRSGRHNLLPTRHSLISSPTTSYGNELDDRNSVNWQDTYDPNASQHTPSLSAMERLAKFEPPPSNFSTSTISPDDHVHLGTTSERSSSLNHIPTIPDLESKSSFPQNPTALSATPTSTMPVKTQSKLSKLASSRANSVTSISSRSTGTSVTGSIKTFPNLRPSVQSERPPSSIASSKDLPPLPPLSHFLKPSEPRGPPSHSSTSSLVRRAIETALQLENMDRDKLTKPKLELYTPAPLVSEGSDRSKTPTPADVKSVVTVKEPPKSSVASPVSPKSRPMSKLAKLAQQRSESTTASVTSAQSTLNLPSPTQSATSQNPRPLSKLAILAQQKVDASRVPKLPKTTTEYLTPIANGSSVTTAITTSYQSLYSLTDPSKPNFIPKLNVVPLQMVTPNSSPSDQKQSKLALKIQQAGQKPNSPGFPSEEEIFTPSIPPLFFPSSSARVTPSAFASVLISDLGPSSIKDKGKGKNAKRRSKDHERRKEKSEGISVDSHPHKSRKHKSSSKESVDHASSSRSFAFDGPSPDDIVLSARRGTHLSPKSSTPASPARA